MKWRSIHSATQKREKMILPEYKEDEWLVMEDILIEVKNKTGRYITRIKAGRIAKELGLVKKSKGFNVYHKSLIDYLIKHLKEYYQENSN